MKAVIGSVEVTQESILSGDHHIVSALALADEQTGLQAGMLLKASDDGFVACVGVDADPDPEADPADPENPIAVLLETPQVDSSGETASAVEPVVIHGAVRLEKLKLADGTAIDADYVELLRKNGIYAL